jgi:hypothetical protein
MAAWTEDELRLINALDGSVAPSTVVVAHRRLIRLG